MLEEKIPKFENENKILKGDCSEIIEAKTDIPYNFSKLEIIFYLFELVKPLMGVMCLAIFFGIIGFLSAIFIPVKAGKFLLLYFDKKILYLIAAIRGLLHYGEQYCNHYIAFKLLALIRHIIFQKLRILCPAKLENKEKGNLISLITSDIELIEVIYAHTISPIAIAFCISTFIAYIFIFC